MRREGDGMGGKKRKKADEVMYKDKTLEEMTKKELGEAVLEIHETLKKALGRYDKEKE